MDLVVRSLVATDRLTNLKWFRSNHATHLINIWIFTPSVVVVRAHASFDDVILNKKVGFISENKQGDFACVLKQDYNIGTITIESVFAKITVFLLNQNLICLYGRTVGVGKRPFDFDLCSWIAGYWSCLKHIRFERSVKTDSIGEFTEAPFVSSSHSECIKAADLDSLRDCERRLNVTLRLANKFVKLCICAVFIPLQIVREDHTVSSFIASKRLPVNLDLSLVCGRSLGR